MVEIVAAIATAHPPQYFTRPDSEDFRQLEKGITVMKQLAEALNTANPDVVIVFGSDHLETFFVSAVPMFTIVTGERAQATFAGHHYERPIATLMAQELLHYLVTHNFDMAYIQEAVLGHAFAAVYEWILTDRNIPVIPILINSYLPPLPNVKRCYELGATIAKAFKSSSERIAIIASGGMSHYPGTWKYSQPEFDFDFWLIEQLENTNHDALLNLTTEQLDEVGNTELLTWITMLGMIGRVPGALLLYQPTWHHGRGFMQFLPPVNQVKNYPYRDNPYPFLNTGKYEFYKYPEASAHQLNKLLQDLRNSKQLRQQIFQHLDDISRQYKLTSKELFALELTLKSIRDKTEDWLRSSKPHPLVVAGAHPLAMLMAVILLKSELSE
ncbi:TPA: hypothetical protein ACS2XB_003058 [Legionella pneumophila]|nr:hypothetical protein [Legionella pneumophila]MCK1859568.1 hypothetical protein [Legionella pneumophila]HDV5714074.1 hypothetical protein [Legionella pneumophila]HDV5941472.1 hypothetical protein [Legionella pneumophila]HEL9698474.1 hypothetical protein [Legionella pneumophila]HEO1456163.1 hypothetical protein [Legionella pneumophila]